MMTMDLEVLRGSRISVPEESGARRPDVISDLRHAIRWNVRGLLVRACESHSCQSQ